jgi:XRE family aerobic/anaerobic benzoate catabolism transcriptional regulator
MNPVPASPSNATTDDYLLQLGQRVRQLRTLRGMARRVLAEASGVSERYLAQLESGKGNASIMILRAIGDAMDVSVDDLVDPRARQSDTYLRLRERLRQADEGTLTQWVNATGPATSNARQRRFVALIGLRGAGKSTLARALANETHLPFIELVQSIESRAGMPLAEVFSLGGQATYRRLERETLDDVLDDPRGGIIAVGGSLVSEPEAFAALLERCVTVWVKAAPHLHMERVVAQGDHRPMANNRDAMSDLKRILEERSVLYSRADVHVDTTGATPAQSLAELLGDAALEPFVTAASPA